MPTSRATPPTHLIRTLTNHREDILHSPVRASHKNGAFESQLTLQQVLHFK